MLNDVRPVSTLRIAQNDAPAPGGEVVSGDPMKRLADAGIKLDVQERHFIRDDKEIQEKLKDPAFVDALIALHKAGIRVSYSVIEFLTPGKAKDRVFIDALISMHRAGGYVEGFAVANLTIEKAHDPVFMQAAIALIGAGITGADEAVTSITMGKSHDAVFMERLVSLVKAGLRFFAYDNDGDDYSVPENLTIEKMRNDDWYNALLGLVKAGFEVNSVFLKEFTVEKAGDKAFLEHARGLIQIKKAALKRLRAAGIEISGQTLTYDKASDKAFVDALITIRKGGMWVDDDVVLNLSFEKAKDKGFISALIRLRKAGVIDNQSNNGWIVKFLTVEKANDPVYINVLIKMHRAGMYITGDTIQYLSIEQAHDQAYVDEIIRSSR